ncbi:DUF3304 domain-containing protein, partial [uncultured Deefgea sp.]|uniref:DUF3304 domain-containing protein n=1 Tax=uncultured Deefgea sp. TaxID=1304914 RepID=UPI002608D5D9
EKDGLRYSFVEGAWKSKTVPIPEYKPDEVGGFHVHFLTGDQIQVRVSSILPNHPEYRPSYPIDPNRAKP